MINNNPSRLLFFDILRIISLSLVIFWHIVSNFPKELALFNFYFWIYNVIEVNIGVIAIHLFFFMSGALLQYNYVKIASFADLISFYSNRLIRIYLPLWISVIVGLFIININYISSIEKLIWSLSGLYYFVQMPVLNAWTWFIGAIALYYRLIFPFLSYIIIRRPFLSIAIIMTNSFVLRYLLNIFPLYLTYNNTILTAGLFPLCNLFDFSLGIFIIQVGFFPKHMHNSHSLCFISALTYPMYLVHGYLLGPYVTDINMITFIPELIIISYIVYVFDRILKSKINI